MDQMKAKSEPQTLIQIAYKLKTKKTDVMDALQLLLSQGEIVDKELGKNNVLYLLPLSRQVEVPVLRILKKSAENIDNDESSPIEEQINTNIESNLVSIDQHLLEIDKHIKLVRAQKTTKEIQEEIAKAETDIYALQEQIDDIKRKRTHLGASGLKESLKL